MSEHGDTWATAAPVSTGEVHVGRKGTTVLVRSGQDVVHVGCVTADFNCLAFLIKRCFLTDLVVVAVKIGHAGGDYYALNVLPGSIADAVTRMNRVRTAARISAEIGPPCLVACASRLRQRLTMRICTSQSTKVTTLTRTGASHKEGHISLLRLSAHAQAQRYYGR